jgi:hypothetical protein
VAIPSTSAEEGASPDNSSGSRSSSSTDTVAPQSSDAVPDANVEEPLVVNISQLFSGEGLPAPPPQTYGSIAEVLERPGEDDEPLQLTDAQIEVAEERVFDLESFYVMKVEKSYVGTIFRGNLRRNSSVAFKRIADKAAAEPTLKGVRFLLLEDPIAPTLQDLQEAPEPMERRPVVLAVPAEGTKLGQGFGDFSVVAAASFGSLVTTLGFALSTYLLADGGAMLEQLEAGDPTPLDTALPIAVGLGGLQLVHELAHLVFAQKNGMKTGFPVPLPSLQLGLFGCITRLLEFAPNRQALFEFAIAGPLAAGTLSLVIYIVGLALSVDLPIPNVDLSSIAAGAPLADAAPPSALAATAAASDALMPIVPAALLQSSLLLGTIATSVLPALQSNAAAVELHPLAVIGFVGALVNALQLLPIGRLDGGRVALAVFGQSSAGLISGICLLLLGLSTLAGGDSPILVRGHSPSPIP